MAKAKVLVRKRTRVAIVLDEHEAVWLKDMLQNGPEDEDVLLGEFRRQLFTQLKEALPGMSTWRPPKKPAKTTPALAQSSSSLMRPRPRPGAK